jgi:peptidoglycan hydrolase CwlO-like protein
LPLINTKLDSIDTNIKSLSSDISSVKDELKINQKALFEFLESNIAKPMPTIEVTNAVFNPSNNFGTLSATL